MTAEELIEVHHAKTHTEALLLQGFLEGEGLHPVLPGSELNDEFAVAQRMANLLSVRVLVPASELERARTCVEVWKQQPPAFDPEPA